MEILVNVNVVNHMLGMVRVAMIVTLLLNMKKIAKENKKFQMFVNGKSIGKIEK